MKLQLDTINKTIKIENDIILSELVENLEKLLPNGLWKEFTIQTHTTINNWNTPLIEETNPPIYLMQDGISADFVARDAFKAGLKAAKEIIKEGGK